MICAVDNSTLPFYKCDPVEDAIHAKNAVSCTGDSSHVWRNSKCFEIIIPADELDMLVGSSFLYSPLKALAVVSNGSAILHVFCFHCTQSYYEVFRLAHVICNYDLLLTH